MKVDTIFFSNNESIKIIRTLEKLKHLTNSVNKTKAHVKRSPYLSIEQLLKHIKASSGKRNVLTTEKHQEQKKHRNNDKEQRKEKTQKEKK